MVRQAQRKIAAHPVNPSSADRAAHGTMREDAAALILCMGRKVLPFTHTQAMAERQGRHGTMFPTGYWADLEREVRASIRRGLL